MTFGTGSSKPAEASSIYEMNMTTPSIFFGAGDHSYYTVGYEKGADYGLDYLHTRVQGSFMDYELLITPSGLIEVTICSLHENVTSSSTMVTGIVNQYGDVLQEALPVEEGYTYVVDVRGSNDIRLYIGGYLYLTSDTNSTWYTGPETAAPTIMPTAMPSSLPSVAPTPSPTRP